MRTFDEIKNHYEKLKKDDFFGVIAQDLLCYLPFNQVKEYLKPETPESEWEQRILSDGSVKKEMTDYMSFAWDKANNCRGISAGRSLIHYSVWIWLLGDDVVKKFGNIQNYEYYGKDKLVAICKYLGLDPDVWDDGIRSNSEY